MGSDYWKNYAYAADEWLIAFSKTPAGIDTPARFALAHAAENYLKAILSKSGRRPKEVNNFGHNIGKMVGTCRNESPPLLAWLPITQEILECWPRIQSPSERLKLLRELAENQRGSIDHLLDIVGKGEKNRKRLAKAIEKAAPGEVENFIYRLDDYYEIANAFAYVADLKYHAGMSKDGTLRGPFHNVEGNAVWVRFFSELRRELKWADSGDSLLESGPRVDEHIVELTTTARSAFLSGIVAGSKAA